MAWAVYCTMNFPKWFKIPSLLFCYLSSWSFSVALSGSFILLEYAWIGWMICHIRLHDTRKTSVFYNIEDKKVADAANSSSSVRMTISSIKILTQISEIYDCFHKVNSCTRLFLVLISSELHMSTAFWCHNHGSLTNWEQYLSHCSFSTDTVTTK